MKKIFISFLLIIAITITGCSTEAPDDPNAKFIKGENGDWIFNFTADEFIEEWTSDPFFKDTDFEIGSDESTAWMIDKDNVHIILTKDTKKSKVSGLCIATNYDISVSQVLLVNIYSMFILKHLDDDLFADKSMHEQISDAIDIILNHEKEEITLVIDDYLYNIESKKNKWFKIIILPRTDVNQPS